MSNLDLYNKVRVCPPEALKTIQAGRLKGMSDINPMWRLKALTEQFGICGIGWKYVITKQWLEQGGNDEVAAFVNIDLFIKVDGQWSDAIPGTGGSSFVAQEKNGLHTSDECFKMALTDAISVACKALGFAADVYWQKDRTKYDQPQGEPRQPQRASQQDALRPLAEVRLGDPLPSGINTAKCTCGKHLTPGIIKYCKQNNINPPTCMDCRKKEADEFNQIMADTYVAEAGDR